MIFKDSRTSLRSWFYAIYLFVATRHDVSGKELERSLGVTNTTAWRMAHGGQSENTCAAAKASAFCKPTSSLQAHVEIDEANFGGYRPGKRGRGAAGKVIVVGNKERGGDIPAQPVPIANVELRRNIVKERVELGSNVSTDQFVASGYTHGAVKHSAKGCHAYNYRQTVTHQDNYVESFWKLFKASIRPTHIHVLSKDMDRYLGEFAYRSNHPHRENAMFDLLIVGL